MPDDLDKDRLRQRRGTAHHIRVREFRRSAGAQRVYLYRYRENILSLALGWTEGRRRPPGGPRNLRPLRRRATQERPGPRPAYRASLRRSGIVRRMRYRSSFFGRRGAYGRFKALLHARGMLERWYEFENRAMEEALLTWCEENGIQPVDVESAQAQWLGRAGKPTSCSSSKISP